jgi:FkbM family methyltransferase
VALAACKAVVDPLSPFDLRALSSRLGKMSRTRWGQTEVGGLSMAMIDLKQRLSGLVGRFGALAPAPAPPQGRKQATDRVVAAIKKGSQAAVKELRQARSAIESAHEDSSAELKRLTSFQRTILKELRKTRTEHLAELRATRAEHLAELRAVSTEHLAELRAIHAAHEADRKLWSDLVKQQKIATSQLDAVGAIGLSDWQLRHPEEASCALVSSMLARRRAKRNVVGSTGLWMFFDRNRERLRELSELLYERLPSADQEVFLKWLMYKWCAVDTLAKGERKAYKDLLCQVDALEAVGSARIGATDFHIFDLGSLGLDIKFLATNHGMLVNDICLNQYVHPMVQPRPGDVLLDVGAYNGDTAVMFGYNTGYDCQVHSFEMSTINIEAFRANLELNPRMLDRTEINHLAVTDTTGATVTFGGGAQPDQISHTYRIGTDGAESAETITLDDYVAQRSLDRVDVVKMDIEGAERLALRGAARTLARFKPRLAICLYHLEDDPLVIPELILEANPNYRFGFRWCNKNNGNEAVLFAIDAEELGRVEVGSGP